MKAIILGICDYLYDCWHDYKIRYEYKYTKDKRRKWEIATTLLWKEGNLWQYIRQHRIAKRVKKIRKS